MLRFALAGNPNSGKTTLFNSLTGSTAHVGNWPGVTVDKKEGVYKKCKEEIAIVDLPGIYSLSPYTPEEVVSRNYILDEKPDCVINIVDATNLERNLYLTTQILEMDVPVIIALNMMDALEKAGDKIDEKILEKNLNVPVVKISALKEKGLSELMNKGYEIAKKGRKGNTVLENCELNHLIGDIKIALEGQKIDNPLFHAIKLVENDEIEIKMHQDALKTVEAFKETFKNDIFGTDFEALVADARYKYISKYYSPALTKKEKKDETKSDKADRILTNRWLGIPIFLMILFGVFHITFSENFLFLGSIIPSFGDWCALEGSDVKSIFFADGLNSPGVILFNGLCYVTDSLTELAANALQNAPAWVSSFICDGVLGGLFAILSFLPQILVLFLLFSILEDSGYMARIAFILDRIFRKFGLSGRAFMPMIMGFGCSIPAMVNTRTLADEKERVATLRVIPFFSCGAKLPILTAIAGGIVTYFGVGGADLITYSMYVLGVVTAIVCVILMRNTTMKGEVPPFIMELPSYHMPQAKNLMLHLWDKCKHFIKKAFTIILASTIIIWFLSNFGWDWKMVEMMDQSILASIGKLIQPIFTPLGFGSQLGTWGWVFAVAAITGLIAKENVIATFGTLAACIISAGVIGGDAEAIMADEEGISAAIAMFEATKITIPALISFIAFNMTTIPCFAAVAAAKGESPTKKSFNWTMIFWVCTSYVVGTIIYLVGSWWWTSLIILALAILAIILIRMNNSMNKSKLGVK